MVDQLGLLIQAVALAKHRNFSRAAASLNLSQPSLTRGIATLERSIGVPLFDRASKGVVPNAFGRVLLERAEVLLKGHADLQRELQLLAELEDGLLTVSAGPYAAETSVAETIARILTAHPRLRIECTVADPDIIVREVLAGQVDVGVARHAGLELNPDLVVEPLAPFAIFLACRPEHPLTKELKLTLAQVLAYPLVTTRLRGEQASTAAHALGKSSPSGAAIPEFTPQVIVNSLGIARLIARGSNAIFPGTHRQIADDVATGRLVKLDVQSPALRTPHGVFYRRDRPLAPAALAFIDTLRTVEAELQMAESSSDAIA